MRKNGQRSYISVRQSTPAARAAASPLPTPYQPGTTCRVWVQPNTHGMARMPSMPAPVPGRRDGREPILSDANSSTGVAARK